MFRQSPIRHQRSKGLRFKNALQICLLLAVCFWLVYQVKHSHDKRKEFDEKDAKLSLSTHGDDEIIKFGRKDLQPRLQETVVKNEKHGEEEGEEDNGGGEDEGKHDEEEPEEDSKAEEREEERRGGGDDEVDEHDQEKSDSEAHREEDLVNEEKEAEEEEKEGEEGDEKEVEDKDDQGENENYSVDIAHDEDSRNTHEAREENYKADDASSAVTHDLEAINTEIENENAEKSKENDELSTLYQEDVTNKTQGKNVDHNSTLTVEHGETSEADMSSNATVTEDKGLEMVAKTENSSISNPTLATGFTNQSDQSNKSAELNEEHHDLLLHNRTETTIDSIQEQNATTESLPSYENSNLQNPGLEQANNSSLHAEEEQSNTNLTISTVTDNMKANPGESSNHLPNSESVVTEEVSSSNRSVQSIDELNASSIEDNADAIQDDKLEATIEMNGTEENLGHDTIDSSDTSIPLEEKEVRIDLDTLPEIQTEGSNTEDISAE